MGLAFITGAGKGIGRAAAVRLAKDGFDIAGTCRSDLDSLQETGRMVRASGREFLPMVYDAADAKASEKAIAEALSGRIPDVIVCNAGIRQDDLFALMSRKKWEDVTRTVLDGFYNTVQPFLMDMMTRRSGRILVIASASGQTGQAGQVNYSAAKAALIGAVKALAREVGPRGILVNAVSPGLIQTDMTKDLPAEKILPLIPLGRAGTPEEVAGVISFLCGPDSSYIHGQILGVNGGLVL